MKSAWPTLAVGKRAYWDTFAGLVPVRVTAIRNRHGDASDTRPSSDWLVSFVVAKEKGPCRKGETFCDQWALHVVPRAAIKRRQHSTAIGFYQIALPCE